LSRSRRRRKPVPVHGDMVHLLLPPQETERGICYLSTKTGKEAVGLVIDSLEGADGFMDYEILVENERMWFPDIQILVIGRD